MVTQRSYDIIDTRYDPLSPPPQLKSQQFPHRRRLHQIQHLPRKHRHLLVVPWIYRMVMRRMRVQVAIMLIVMMMHGVSQASRAGTHTAHTNAHARTDARTSSARSQHPGHGCTAANATATTPLTQMPQCRHEPCFYQIPLPSLVRLEQTQNAPDEGNACTWMGIY